MASARSLLNRVAKLEYARQRPKSRIELAYGSFDAFAEQVRGEVGAGALDRTDMLGETGDGGVLRCLRQWHEMGLV